MVKLITSQQNVRYYSGFTGSVAVLIIWGKTATLVVDGRYSQQARDEAKKGITVEEAPLTKSLLEVASKILNKNKATLIGYEDDKMDVSSFNKLTTLLPKTKFVSISKQLRDERCIKTPEEIVLIRKACLIADVSFDAIVRMIRPGITEKEIAIELEYIIKIMGADEAAFESIVASGAHAALPHCRPRAEKIKSGNMILMDYGARFKGYNSDITRMVSLGVPSKKQRFIYDTLLKAQLFALSKVKSGVKASVIDSAAREVLKKAKLDKFFTHATGHGVGLAIHEGPKVSMLSTDVLKENMVITVEPGVYIKGFGGFRIEDTVLVTKKGFEILTRSTKGLIAI